LFHVVHHSPEKRKNPLEIAGFFLSIVHNGAMLFPQIQCFWG
jgi:hypothetical protein